MADFKFELKDHSDVDESVPGMRLAKAFRDHTLNRDPDTGTLKPLRTTRSIDPDPQKAITTFNMSQIMQGSAIAKPAVAPYDAFNQFLSSNLTQLLGTEQGNPNQSLGNQKTLVPEDILARAGQLGAKNAASAAGAGTPPTSVGPMFSKAQTWVDAHVPYNQGAFRDGYRTDCSGFVSMCWDLGPPGQTTVTLVNYSHIITPDGLQPGDIVLNKSPGNAGHVVLFEKWSDDAHTKYWAYEQSGDGGAHHREIPYPYFHNAPGYLPYKRN